MRVGIVGSEGAKFTGESEIAAKRLIREILTSLGGLHSSFALAELPTEVVSGGCHLGGIDQWAAEIGKELNLKVIEYLPKCRSWHDGYKPRNLLIARRSDVLHCITVDRLPSSYTGMRFALCYHCGTSEHVKSGGCWTMKEAIKLGKPGILHVVKNALSTSQ